VAKEGTSKQPASKRKEAKATPAIAGLDLYHPILIDCNLVWEPIAPNNDGLKPIQFYDAVLRNVDIDDRDKTTFAFCELSAGQKIKDKKTFEVRCTYIVGVKHEEGNRVLLKADRKKLVEELTAVSAWELFKTVYSLMAVQTHVNFSQLPGIPKLRWSTKTAGGEEAKEAEANT
jgi:hypothetical protein